MAEPARLPEEDQPDITPDIPQLRDLEEGAAGGEPQTGGEGQGQAADGSGGGEKKQQDGGEGSGSGKSRGSYSPGDLRGAEQEPKDGLYNEDGDRRRFWQRKAKEDKKSRLSRRQKILFSVLSVGTAGAVSISAFFFAGIFNLPNFLKNIEQAGFQRYQVDLNGRSDKWLQAYMELRFGEVDDPNLAPQDRDNVFFKADRVDTNKPLTDWYRTLRASKFEEQVFNAKGIRFTSIAKKQGNSVVYRSGIISFQGTDRPITFDPGQATFDALARGDPNAFNGTLNDFAKVEKEFKTDKQARAAIKEIVREHNPNWWKAVKRYHLRQDIQNLIGVRKWKFFEKTRNNLHEKKISMRNRLITAALPDEGNTSNFVKCLFGIPDCKASSDPASPDAQDHAPNGSQKEGDKTNGNPDNPQTVGDGTGEPTLSEGAGEALSPAGDVAGKILSKLIAKAGVLSLLDSLSRFDQAIRNHTISKLVAQAKTQYAVGAFTVIGVAADQLTTGQQSSSEVNDFMLQFKHATNTEGWTSVVDPQNSASKVSAASNGYVKSKDKQQFCSEKHQAEMEADPKAAEDEYQYWCDKNKIGGPNQAKQLEDAWNSGPGAVAHPVLAAYHSATGGVFDVFNSVTSAITEPIIKETLKTTGTEDDVKRVTASVGKQALEYGGAVSPITEKSPSGQVAQEALQGSAAMAEADMRDNGAASTTTFTMARTQKDIAAYQADQEHTSLFDRYLSPSNPKSLFATEFFALTTSGLSDLGKSLVGIFSSAISNPFNAMTMPAHAAVPDGYAASKFAGIDTYDFPQECLDISPLRITPQSSTNADDLGYFKPDELNWDLMTNQQDWYKALYDKVGGDEAKAKAVWNCALFDNTTRSGISSQYGYYGENALKPADNQQGDSVSQGTISGNAQQVAQDILNNPNVTYQFSAQDDMKLTAQGKPGTNGVPVDIRLLQIVAALAQHHKVDVSALESYGQGHSAGSDHYSGHAVDIANIDGVPAYKNITSFWDIIAPYSKDAVFLQGQCAGVGPTPSGMTRLAEDVCNHQHISVNPPSGG